MGAWFTGPGISQPGIERYDDYNPLKKLWKHSPLQHPLAVVMFGRRAASIWHVGFAIELILYFAGHIVMVAATGLRKNARSMITGWHGDAARSTMTQ